MIAKLAIETFLHHNLNTNFEIERLNDRSVRRNLSIHRKDVYLVTSGGNRYILLHFSSQYKTIYLNYIRAREVLGKLVRGDKWVTDKDNLLILLPYLGPAFDKPDISALGKITDFLSITYQPTRFKDFETPRYISKVLENNEGASQFVELKRVLFTINGKKMRFEYGPGIEDPSFSNFTDGVEKTYLVDLDNFSNNVNLDYEFGFLAADINLEFPGRSYDLKSLEQITRRKINRILFGIGYISRLATVVLDFNAGESILEERVKEIVQEIEGRCLELFKTLE